MKKLFCMVMSVCVLISGAFFAGFCPSGAAGGTDERYSADIMPLGGTTVETITKEYHYARKEDDSYYNPYKLPTYLASMSNSCAVTAAGDAIGYYDRLYEELIPNHTSFTFMGQFVYGSQGASVNAMHQSLYDLMGSTSEGTTLAGYLDGFKEYVYGKGRTARFTRAFSGSALNKSQYMAAFKSGKLFSVFVDGFSLSDLSGIRFFDGYDEVLHFRLVGAHIMAAYGYKNIRYYDASDNLIREDNYLYVASGYSSPSLALLKLNEYTTVVDGYVTEIF